MFHSFGDKHLGSNTTWCNFPSTGFFDVPPPSCNIPACGASGLIIVQSQPYVNKCVTYSNYWNSLMVLITSINTRLLSQQSFRQIVSMNEMAGWIGSNPKPVVSSESLSFMQIVSMNEMAGWIGLNPKQVVPSQFLSFRQTVSMNEMAGWINSNPKQVVPSQSLSVRQIVSIKKMTGYFVNKIPVH